MRAGARAVVTRPVVVIALLGVIVSCTGSGTSTSSTSPPVTGQTTSTSTTVAVDPRLNLALPIDPDVLQGSLDNGMVYYVRRNDSPGGRAELRLMVDAGSVQEDPDQAGIAHFLEHMMFNGTERFPKNDLIDVLEAFGPQFGPHINAYTSFDETVYMLSLTTDDDELVQLGVDVLSEWASRATLTQPDVVEERGVILDEWRLRAQGFSARVNEQLEQMILGGTVYEDHLPIGTVESIESTSPSALRRFYQDWYRPDRMAVVAVGDFDLGEMEELIVSAFADLDSTPDPREWTAPVYAVPAEPRARGYVDEEAASAGATLVWPVPTGPLVTVGDYQRSILVTLGLEILVDRLSEDALSGGGPLLGAGVVDFAWTRAIGARGLDARIRAGMADEGVEAVLVEVERMRRDGVTDAEFQRALNRFATASRQRRDSQETIQDSQIALQIVSHHLEGGDLMNPNQRFGVESDVVERVTKDDLDAAIVSVLTGAPVVLAVGPDDEEVGIPDEERLLEILNGLPTLTLSPRQGRQDTRTELMAVPERAPIIVNTVNPDFGYTTLGFENGATVYLWETDIATEGVLAMIEGFGGTSVLAVEDLAEAFLMTDIVARSGVGDFDVPGLQRFLADRIVSVDPWMSETRQGLIGGSSSKDVEVMLQLLYLTMTAPRFDDAAVDAVLDEMATLNATRDDLPDVLFDEALNSGYYGDDPRHFVLPSVSELANFDVERAEGVFEERFGDAGEFAFTFVGDFNLTEMVDLAARYIGNLPGDTVVSGFVDNQPLPPREVQVLTVQAGAGEQAQVGLFFTNELEPGPRDRVTARLLELILTARLRERIREGLSATYSITAGIDLQRDPDPFAEAFIHSTGSPTDLERISNEVTLDLADLQTGGPAPDQFSTAVEQLRDELELFDNWLLATALVTAHLYPDQPVRELFDRPLVLDGITSEDVRDLARIAFNLDQRIEVRQVPSG